MAGKTRQYKRPSQETIIKALYSTGGLMAPAADALNISRATLHAWVKNDEELQQAVRDAREAMIDVAESKLNENVEQGKEASIFFLLKCLAKQRGFVEKENHDVSGEITLRVVYDKSD